MRSVLTKLTILHLSALLLFAAGLAVLFRTQSFNQAEQDRYFSSKWKKSLIEQYRNDYQMRMGAVSDNSIWDDSYNLALKPTKNWLLDNFPDAGRNYGINGMAIFDRKGRCIDKLSYDKGHDNFRSPKLLEWLKQNKTAKQTSFFIRDKDHIDQFFVSTLHPSSDREMKVPYSGYLLMVRRWTDAALRRIEKSSGVRLSQTYDTGDRVRIQESNRFSIPLRGPDNEHLANVVVETGKEHIETPGATIAIVMRIFAVFGIGMMLLLVNGVYVWVIKPFRRISKALSTGDPENLSELRKNRSEFGIIASHLQDTLMMKLQLEDKTFELESMVLSQNGEIERRKYRDSLTGLPNRRFLRECLSEISVLEEDFESVSMILMDIDDLQLINDGLHEAAGDDLLLNVANKLRQAVPLSGVVVRYGGDEFAVLMPCRGPKDTAENIVFEIKSAFRQPLDCHGVSFQCTFCIGVATMYQQDVRSNMSFELIRQADIALYHAKSQGKDSIVIYDDQLARSLEKRVLTEAGLREALKNKELELYYQPIVSIQDGTLHAVEALIRWNHPDRGLVMPGEFIAIAESSDIIISMGYYQMKQACRAMMKLWDDHPEIPKFVVSINLSGKQLDCPDIVEHVELVLEMTGFPPEYMQLEVTETTMAQNMDLAIERLHQLRALGVLIAIDDFGTGYSSMSSLTDLPADVLKVDMSFVQKLPHDMESISILRAVSSMARSFEMETVAEGVENEEQLEFLAILGFDHIQGWIMSKAIPASNLELLLVADPDHFAHKLEIAKKVSDPEAA